MFRPSRLRFCTTQSIAAMTCETSVAPWRFATFRLTIRESGAIPTNPSV